MAQKQRRGCSAQFKFEMVMERLWGEKTIAQIFRERDLIESPVHKWCVEFMECTVGIFEDKRFVSSAPSDHSNERMTELERMVGRLTMKNEVLQNGASWLADTKAN